MRKKVSKITISLSEKVRITTSYSKNIFYLYGRLSYPFALRPLKEKEETSTN